MDAATEEVLVAFRQSHIRAILLKGPAIAQWLYDSDETRSYTDTDLLVSSVQVPSAELALTERGFAVSDPPSIRGDRPRHATAWTRERDGTAVDLHQSIIGAGAAPEDLWKVLSGKTQRMRFRDLDIEILDVPARCALVALHAAHHGPGALQPFADLRRALERVNSTDWRRASDVAREIDGLGAFCLGLSLTSEGVDLLRELSLSAVPRAEAVLRAEGTPGALGLHWLVHEAALSEKLTVLFGKVFPPPAYLRDWSPFPINGVAGLIKAYFWRWLFLVRQAVPATRSVLRARRRSARKD